jgi:putative transposase
MPPLVLSDDEVQQLQGIASSRSLPHSIVQRAQIVLACGAGETNTSIAKRMGLTGMTVGKWRKRYRELGLEGMHDELRPGRPRTYEDDIVAEVINRALRPPRQQVAQGLRAEAPRRARWTGCCCPPSPTAMACWPT